MVQAPLWHTLAHEEEALLLCPCLERLLCPWLGLGGLPRLPGAQPWPGLRLPLELRLLPLRLGPPLPEVAHEAALRPGRSRVSRPTSDSLDARC